MSSSSNHAEVRTARGNPAGTRWIVVFGATERRWLKLSLADTVAGLNPVIRGWCGYFRRGNATKKLQDLDLYLEERLRCGTLLRTRRMWETTLNAAGEDHR